MSDTKPFSRPELPKRFYTAVSVMEAPDASGFAVQLDGRGLKTPLRRPLTVPNRPLAERLAAEWRDQGERIDPATMPATRLVNTVIDAVADDPGPVRQDLSTYIETDMLFYRAGYPDRLVARQRAAWDPVVADAEQRLSVRFTLAEGVMHVAQDARAILAFKGRIATVEDPFAVAALHQMTTLTGSALLAFAVANGRLSAAEAWSAAHVDEDWNIELWGVDAEAAARRAGRWQDMLAAAELLMLVAPSSPAAATDEMQAAAPTD